MDTVLEYLGSFPCFYLHTLIGACGRWGVSLGLEISATPAGYNVQSEPSAFESLPFLGTHCRTVVRKSGRKAGRSDS